MFPGFSLESSAQVPPNDSGGLRTAAGSTVSPSNFTYGGDTQGLSEATSEGRSCGSGIGHDDDDSEFTVGAETTLGLPIQTSLEGLSLITIHLPCQSEQSPFHPDGKRERSPDEGLASSAQLPINPEQSQTVRRIVLRKRTTAPFQVKLPSMSGRLRVRDGRLVPLQPEADAPKLLLTRIKSTDQSIRSPLALSDHLRGQGVPARLPPTWTPWIRPQWRPSIQPLKGAVADYHFSFPATQTQAYWSTMRSVMSLSLAPCVLPGAPAIWHPPMQSAPLQAPLLLPLGLHDCSLAPSNPCADNPGPLPTVQDPAFTLPALDTWEELCRDLSRVSAEFSAEVGLLMANPRSSMLSTVDYETTALPHHDWMRWQDAPGGEGKPIDLAVKLGVTIGSETLGTRKMRRFIPPRIAGMCLTPHF